MKLLKLSAIALVLASCTENAESPEPTTDAVELAGGKADQIAGRDDPSGLLAGSERRLAQLVSANEIGQSFGVDDDKIPYPDTYWPMVDNGIAVEWMESNGNSCNTFNECSDPVASPLEKYMNMVSPTRVDDAIEWEIRNHGEDVPNVASWFGHCPGWVATAMLYPPMPGAVWVDFNGFAFERCVDGDPDCTKLEIGDLNALGAEAHEGARSRFIGARCDTDPADIERDDNGRIVRKGKGCQGLNAGALLILMGNRLKMEKKPFAIDAQNEGTTEQIWNQPAFRYTVNRFEPLSESEAANLVASGGDERDGDEDVYQWNANAQGFAFVDFSLDWVTETVGPNTELVSGAHSFKTTRMVAVIELDRDASDPNAQIIGGEYVDDASVGASRLRVAPFAWVALDVGFDSRHNPHVRGQQIKQLLNLALQDAPGGDSDDTNACAHDVCEEGDLLVSGCDPCVTAICEADPFCCENSWDSLCSGAVPSMCGESC